MFEEHILYKYYFQGFISFCLGIWVLLQWWWIVDLKWRISNENVRTYERINNLEEENRDLMDRIAKEPSHES